jgi:Bacterial protein of unknown function (DUF899)
MDLPETRVSVSGLRGMRDAASGVSTLVIPVCSWFDKRRLFPQFGLPRTLPDEAPAAHRSAAKVIAPEKESMMNNHEVVSREEWAAARAELLASEKEHTRLGDELAQRRRELPWVRVEKEYRFDTDDGTRTLAELFNRRIQLLV